MLRAGGYLIQLLPGAPDGVIDRLEKGIMAAGPVTNLLMENDDPESLLRRVMKDFELEILETVPVGVPLLLQPGANGAALMSLGRKQLTELAEDPNGIELTCQFCDSRQQVHPGGDPGAAGKGLRSLTKQTFCPLCSRGQTV